MKSLKMKAGLLSGLGLAVAFSGGCTTTRTLAVSPANAIAPTYEHGTPCLQSVKQNTVTVWLLTPEYRTNLQDLRPPAFRVLVKNGGDRDFEFSPASITASADGRAVQVLTAGEYAKEIDRQAAILAHMLDLGSAGAKEKADQSEAFAAAATPGTTTGVNGPLPDFSTIPHGLAADAKEQIDATTERRRAEIEAWRKDLLADAQMMLDRQTVAPGAMAGGVIRLAPEDLGGGPLKIVIAAGGETHEFLFDVGR
jgi:hypothetical protein